MSLFLISSSQATPPVTTMHAYIPPSIPVVVARLVAKGTNIHSAVTESANQSAPPAPAPLEGVVEEGAKQERARRYQGASIKQVAESALTTWRDIDTHLSPIVGAGGVAALFKRSLYLTSKDYPCLRRPLALFQPAEYNLLYLALLAQERSEAIAVNGAILHTFSRLLAGLIGVQLTQRLLLSILNHPSKATSSLPS